MAAGASLDSMVRMNQHGYRPSGADSTPPSLIAACTCGWRGTAIATPDESPDPGFSEWLESHYNSFLQAGGLRGMVAFDNISQLVDGFTSLVHVHWISSDRRIVALSWGWWATINRTARAILMLTSIGQSREAVPLVRVVFEHSLYMQALIRHGEPAVDAAVREHIRQSRSFILSAKDGPVLGGKEIDVNDIELPEATPDAAWTQQVVTICDRLGLTNTLYVIYRTLCRYVHPTLFAAEQFLRSPDSIDLGISKEPDFNQDSDLLFWTGVMMVWAGQALNALLAQPVLSQELQKAAQELGVVPIDELPTSSQFGAIDVSPERIEQIMFDDCNQSDPV